jgi:hypothetical protein
VGHGTHAWDKSFALVAKPAGRRPLGTPGNTQKDNTKMDLKDTRRAYTELI